MNKKILLMDIETMSNIAYVWGKYEQNVIEFEKEWYLLCFAWKWLGQNRTHAASLPDFATQYKKDPTNDYCLIKLLWELFDEADVIVAHNGDAFDIKMVNARFAYHGFLPPSPYKTVDTKKVAKRYFRFNSNKLDDLGSYLELGRKIDTGGFELWLGCLHNDPVSWYKMIKYNKQDVVLLEKVYLKLLPWITNHPIRSMVSQHSLTCENCNGNHLTKQGTKPSRTGPKQQWKCQDCGAWKSIAVKNG